MVLKHSNQIEFVKTTILLCYKYRSSSFLLVWDSVFLQKKGFLLDYWLSEIMMISHGSFLFRF